MNLHCRCLMLLLSGIACALPLAADTCPERAAAVWKGQIPAGQSDPDCDTGSRTAAYVNWLVAAVAGISAASAAAKARKVRGGKSERPPHWPKDLTGPNAFCDLGKAIASEDYLKQGVPMDRIGPARPLTDLEKTLYIFERMREAARVYGLRTSEDLSIPDGARMVASRPEERTALGVSVVAGGILYGLAHLVVPEAMLGFKVVSAMARIGAGVLGFFASKPVASAVGRKFPLGSGDPENANGLKMFGVGNCGEWTWAFNKLLQCAGVRSSVIFADESGDPGVSEGFGGNDTALVVKQQTPDGTDKNRVFDIFRQMFSNPDNMPDTPSAWSNMPMTKNDILDYDSDPSHPGSIWSDQGTIGKKGFIKNSDEQVIWTR